MRTDLETFLAMLSEADVEYTLKREEGVVVVELEVHNKNVTGYSGFATNFIFNAVEKLDHVEVWE